MRRRRGHHLASRIWCGSTNTPSRNPTSLSSRSGTTENRHPPPEDVLLLIEVSDTALAYDRGVKLPLYARAGIREVRTVDLPGEVIERHTDPSVEGFRTLERMRRGKEIKSAALPELAFRVETVLG
jgi:hypothetical protein